MTRINIFSFIYKIITAFILINIDQYKMQKEKTINVYNCIFNNLSF